MDLPIEGGIEKIPDAIVAWIIFRVRALADKYATTYAEVVGEIAETKSSLSSLIDELTGSECDLKGLVEFKSLLRGEHRKTVNIKKAMLEKMFPKAGEDKIEIRFAGFTGDWKREKLSNLVQSFEYELNAAAIKFDGYNKYL